MEASLPSTTTSKNPSNPPKTNSLSDPSNPNMSTPDPEPRSPESQSSESKTLENPSKEADPDQQHDEGGEAEEQEEGECGFCLFMKAGGCRESFIDWEKCIEEAEKNNENIVDKCFEVTGALRKCMEAHQDYYEPILRAERAAEEEAIQELNKEKAAQDSETNADSKVKGSEGLERN